ncbi:MAG: TCR/Tet family MFS transporter [Gammaproteobacteria bacterium]|nr:TCR/Tet family MFS transporter [Gammaproteobacteria bacterium]
MKSSGKALAFVLITILIDAMGIGIIVPVIPSLLLELVGGSLSSVAVYNGWLMILFAGLQFLSAPILGNLSDAYGRRPVLLVSLAVYAVDLIIMALAPTIGWLFLGRALSGIFSATFVVASAYIADVTTMAERARGFGWMGAAFGVGFVVGPAVGGLLGDIDNRLPFFVAAGLAGANVVYGYFVLPESLDPANRRPFSLRRAHVVGTLRRMLGYPVVRGVLLALLFYNIAQDANLATWTFVTMEKFDWTPFDIGMSMTFIGVCIAIFQGFTVGPAVKWLGDNLAVMIGFGLFVLSFIGLAFATAGWQMYAWTVPFAMGSIAGPAASAILSKRLPADEQGQLQGGLTALRSITACFGPLMMTWLFSYFTSPAAPVQFAGASFFAAAVLAFVALVTVVRTLRGAS